MRRMSLPRAVSLQILTADVVKSSAIRTSSNQRNAAKYALDRVCHGLAGHDFLSCLAAITKRHVAKQPTNASSSRQHFALHKHFLASFKPIRVWEEMDEPPFDDEPNLMVIDLVARLAKMSGKELVGLGVRQTGRR